MNITNANLARPAELPYTAQHNIAWTADLLVLSNFLPLKKQGNCVSTDYAETSVSTVVQAREAHAAA